MTWMVSPNSVASRTPSIARIAAKLLGRPRHAQLVPLGARRRHLGKPLELFGPAEHEQLRHVDVADVGAALGLVHVVGRDEQRHPAGGKLEEQIPQLPAGDGVDARGGLVEKQQLRLVDQRAGQREPLLPSAGERAGELVEAVAQSR